MATGHWLCFSFRRSQPCVGSCCQPSTPGSLHLASREHCSQQRTMFSDYTRPKETAQCCSSSNRALWTALFQQFSALCLNALDPHQQTAGCQWLCLGPQWRSSPFSVSTTSLQCLTALLTVVSDSGIALPLLCDSAPHYYYVWQHYSLLCLTVA